MYIVYLLVDKAFCAIKGHFYFNHPIYHDSNKKPREMAFTAVYCAASGATADYPKLDCLVPFA